jgi:hypothetical protein
MHVWPRRAHASHHIALVMCTISPPLLRALCSLTLAVSDAATCDTDFSSNNCEGVCTIMSMECSAFTACVASMHYQENGFAGVSTCQNEPVLLQASLMPTHARDIAPVYSLMRMLASMSFAHHTSRIYTQAPAVFWLVMHRLTPCTAPSALLTRLCIRTRALHSTKSANAFGITTTEPRTHSKRARPGPRDSVGGFSFAAAAAAAWVGSSFGNRTRRRSNGQQPLPQEHNISHHRLHPRMASQQTHIRLLPHTTTTVGMCSQSPTVVKAVGMCTQSPMVVKAAGMGSRWPLVARRPAHTHLLVMLVCTHRLPRVRAEAILHPHHRRVSWDRRRFEWLHCAVRIL